MDANLCRRLRKLTTSYSGLSLPTATAERNYPLGACTARVIIQAILYIIEFIVLPLCSHQIILGWDFLSRHSAVINCGRAEVELFPFMDPADTGSPSLPLQKLIVAEDTTVPPSAAVLVPLSCSSLSEENVLFTPSPLFVHRRCFLLPFAVLNVEDGETTIVVANPGSWPRSLLRGECLGTVEPMDCAVIVDVPDDLPHVEIDALCPPPCATSPPSPDVLSHALDANLTPPERDQLLQLLHRFQSSFD